MYDSAGMADDNPDAIDFGDPNADPSGLPERLTEPPWDADDERRRKDQFAPPMESCECYCLHCNRVFMSDQIWFQRVIGDKNGFEGFWMCPTPNCGGAGFTFDIFPTDPNHPANSGWTDNDDDEPDYDETDGSEFNDPADPNLTDAIAEWDPDEPLYKSMDDQDGDIEGEEWKFGLEPGDPLPDSQRSDAYPRWEDENKLYDEPDQRPREIDWSNRDDRDGPITEDDIPF